MRFEAGPSVHTRELMPRGGWAGRNPRLPIRPQQKKEWMGRSIAIATPVVCSDIVNMRAAGASKSRMSPRLCASKGSGSRPGRSVCGCEIGCGRSLWKPLRW